LIYQRYAAELKQNKQVGKEYANHNRHGGFYRGSAPHPGPSPLLQAPLDTSSSARVFTIHSPFRAGRERLLQNKHREHPRLLDFLLSQSERNASGFHRNLYFTLTATNLSGTHSLNLSTLEWDWICD